MGYLGLEPRTYRLKAEYSTIELATHYSDSRRIVKETKVKNEFFLVD